jgi:hypothetical protein
MYVVLDKEKPYIKCMRLKLSGSQAYDRSDD